MDKWQIAIKDHWYSQMTADEKREEREDDKQFESEQAAIDRNSHGEHSELDFNL